MLSCDCFLEDVRRCAIEIYCDLCCNGVPRCLSDLGYICQRFGKTLLFDASIPIKTAAFWDGQELYLSFYLTRTQLFEIIPHELVHALADTPRWSYLNNCITDNCYDRAIFQEAVACMVGKMFAHQLTA